MFSLRKKHDSSQHIFNYICEKAQKKDKPALDKIKLNQFSSVNEEGITALRWLARQGERGAVYFLLTNFDLAVTDAALGFAELGYIDDVLALIAKQKIITIRDELQKQAISIFVLAGQIKFCHAIILQNEEFHLRRSLKVHLVEELTKASLFFEASRIIEPEKEYNLNYIFFNSIIKKGDFYLLATYLHLEWDANRREDWATCAGEQIAELWSAAEILQFLRSAEVAPFYELWIDKILYQLRHAYADMMFIYDELNLERDVKSNLAVLYALDSVSGYNDYCDLFLRDKYKLSEANKEHKLPFINSTLESLLYDNQTSLVVKIINSQDMMYDGKELLFFSLNHAAKNSEINLKVLLQYFCGGSLEKIPIYNKIPIYSLAFKGHIETVVAIFKIIKNPIYRLYLMRCAVEAFVDSYNAPAMEKMIRLEINACDSLGLQIEAYNSIAGDILLVLHRQFFTRILICRNELRDKILLFACSFKVFRFRMCFLEDARDRFPLLNYDIAALKQDCEEIFHLKNQHALTYDSASYYYSLQKLPAHLQYLFLNVYPILKKLDNSLPIYFMILSFLENEPVLAIRNQFIDYISMRSAGFYLNSSMHNKLFFSISDKKQNETEERLSDRLELIDVARKCKF